MKTGERLEGELMAAMKAETEGYHFYKMAAAATQDEKGREVFEQLANEELLHLRYLSKQREALIERGKIDTELVIGERAKLDEKSPIFSERLRERLEDAHYEMTALSIGAQLELNSVKHYRQQSERAEDKEVEKLFVDLAEWERGHHEALSRQLEELREDYWNAGGFAPW